MERRPGKYVLTMVDGKEMTAELASDLHIWVVVCVNTHNFLKIFLFCFFFWFLR